MILLSTLTHSKYLIPTTIIFHYYLNFFSIIAQKLNYFFLFTCYDVILLRHNVLYYLPIFCYLLQSIILLILYK